jgi:UDPglucose 6-dehydrogenase
MTKICVVGTGYVGLVTGTCLADIGHAVICVDNDRAKIALLKKGKIPIYEPGLEELIKKNVKRNKLSFDTNLAASVRRSEVIFIAVGTPPREDGSADLSFVEAVAKQIAENMTAYKLIVDKSTVPVETGNWVKVTIERNLKSGVDFDIASNPEFLREGNAITDTLHPDRIVIGVESGRAERLLKEVYAPLKARVIVTDIKSAEIIKHASNSFLATKISFINAIANICERVGADIEKVSEGMGADKRIGAGFLNAGIGFGGFCFPKDLEAFTWISSKLGYEFNLLKETKKINEDQKINLVKKIEDALWLLKGKKIGILGLAFKPNTDDMRFAPSIDIIKLLQEKGATINAFDPVALKKAKSALKNVNFSRDAYATAKGCDCLVILTEWDEFKKLDLKRIKKLLKHPIIVDGRNIFEPELMKKLGFIYKSIGR